MIITERDMVENRQSQQDRKTARKSSERFSRLVKSHAQQQRQSDQIIRRANEAQRTKGREDEALRLVQTQPGAAMAEPALTHAEPDREVASSANTPPQLHKLADELGQQIELHRTAASVRGIDITFHSRSMAGLQVQIREEKGELAIRFLAPSANSSLLLSRHSRDLKESLVNRGLRIRNVVVARGYLHATSSGGRSAEG